MDKEILKMAEQLKALSNVAVLQYTDIVNDILDGRIADEQEIACILDGMLDFCQFNEIESLKLVNKNLIQLYWDIGKEICER